MEAFATLAEVAVGLAGFGSIAIVLAREEGWSGSDLFRIASFLMASLGALFLALLPIGLAEGGFAETGLWRVSSAAIGTATLVMIGVNLRMRARHLDPSLYLGPMLLVLIGSTALASLVAQVVNLAEKNGPASGMPPFFGVLWMLGYACLVLVRVLFFRPSPAAAEDA